MIRASFVASLLFVVLPTLQAASTITVDPLPVSDVLVNPGKGWVAYAKPGDYAPAVLAYCALGYQRFVWSELNPAEGRYNWQPIDEAMARWKAVGRPFAFGVMCLSSHFSGPGGYATPKWVFDAGAKGISMHLGVVNESTAGVPGDKMVPVFTDPIFQAKLHVFLTALGARYDGSPDIAFVDFRGYGNWGEGHMFPFSRINPALPSIPPEGLRALIQMQHDAFPRTQVIVPWGEKQYDAIYDWAVSQGMGMRRDGICGNSDGSETARALGKAPAVFEFYDDYVNMKEFGWWDGHPKPGHDKPGYGHPLAGCVEKGMPSWIELGDARNGAKLLADDRPLVERLANRMGYHFVLTEAKVPRMITLSREAELDLSWLNDGVAPIYVPAATAVALLDGHGHAVAVGRVEKSSPAAWVPGQTVNESAQFSISHVPPGVYRLAVGLVAGEHATTPIIRLGIAGRTEEGWYPLAPVGVGR